MALKLQQGQVWKHGAEFIRIVHLARLEVGYLEPCKVDNADEFSAVFPDLPLLKF